MLKRIWQSFLHPTRSQPIGSAASKYKLTPIEREFLPPLLELQESPASPLLRAVLWSGMFAVCIFLLWSVYGELDVVANAAGRVVPEGGAKIVQADEMSILRAIHVKQGQRVKRGDMLIELDPTQRSAELNGTQEKIALLNLDLSRLNRELHGELNRKQLPEPANTMRQDFLQLARDGAFRARLAEAQHDIQAKNALLQMENELLAKAQLNAQTARSKELAARPYVEQAISRFDYLRLQESANSSESELAAQQQKLAAATQTHAAAMQRIGQLEQEHKQQILSEMQDKTFNLVSLGTDDKKISQQMQRKKLLAPVDGVVQAIEVTTVGGVVSGAQTLLTIVPDDAPLVIEAALKNEDVGQVKIGQQVSIKVETFPFMRYGAIRGEVMWISPDASALEQKASSGKLGNEESKGMPSYRMAVRPEKPFLISEGKPAKISVGMVVMVDVHLGKRKVIDFLLAPIHKGLSNSVTGK